MGSRRECTRILSLEGFRLEAISWERDAPSVRVRIKIERRRIRGYECSGSRRRTWRVRDRAERSWDDLPCAGPHRGQLDGVVDRVPRPRQRAAVEGVCTDMHQPYLNAVGTVLKGAEIVFDKFHVLQLASAALDEVRRQEFFRAGAVMRAYGRGKRWLLLRRWKTVRGSKRHELQRLFSANRRLCRAYVRRRYAGNGCPR